MDGFRFACQPGCTVCCDREGRVYLTEEDLSRAAAWIGLSREDFEAKYVVRTRHTLRLRKPRGRQCHFLENGGCAIHPVKPVQCRLFPFWPELVERPAAWRRTAQWCPGIGQGPLIQIGQAHEIASEMRAAYPSQYASK